MSFVCPSCGHVGSTTRKLSDWEVAEMRRRAKRVMVEHPRNPWRGERESRLRHLASEYGISLRTLQRYLERAA